MSAPESTPSLGAPSLWVLGHGELLHAAQARAGTLGLPLRSFEVLDAASRGFFARLSAANQVAFGGLGMPAWVQLDCCTLPGLMVGLGGSKASLSATTLADLRGHVPPEDEDFWPYSEFCGILRGSDEIVGVSSFSLIARRGLALRAKALGLWLTQRTHQLGITQWDNPAVGLHTRLGPLKVVAPQAVNHSRPDSSFVYRLTVPSDDTLRAWVLGQPLRLPSLPVHETLPSSADALPALVAKVQAWMGAGKKVWVVSWGPEETGFHLE